MAPDGSVAPKECINIKFIRGAAGTREQPLGTLIEADFAGKPEDTTAKQLSAISIGKGSFAGAMKMKEMGLERSLHVPNVLSEDDPYGTLTAALKFDPMRGFSLDPAAQQVSERRKLMELRDVPVVLKGRPGSIPSFRKALSDIVGLSKRRAKLEEHLEKSASAEEYIISVICGDRKTTLVASRSADLAVERLLEGVAFLTARLREKSTTSFWKLRNCS